MTSPNRPRRAVVPATVHALRVLAVLAALAAILGAGYATALGQGHTLSPLTVLTGVTGLLAAVAGLAARDVRRALVAAAPRRT